MEDHSRSRCEIRRKFRGCKLTVNAYMKWANFCGFLMSNSISKLYGYLHGYSARDHLLLRSLLNVWVRWRCHTPAVSAVVIYLVYAIQPVIWMVCKLKMWLYASVCVSLWRVPVWQFNLWLLYLCPDSTYSVLLAPPRQRLCGWLRGTVGKTSVFDRRTFPVLHSTCSWWLTTYVGKPSAVGQPTRPTQPFILSGYMNEYYYYYYYYYFNYYYYKRILL